MVLRNSCGLAEERDLFPLDDLSVISYDQNTSRKQILNERKKMSLSVEKTLRKAQSHLKAGELAEAGTLYKAILSKFPKNMKAIKGYQRVNSGVTAHKSPSFEPPQDKI